MSVEPDRFTYLGLAAGFGGFLAAVVAIWLARKAQRTADEAIVRERRLVFELEILRDLTEDVDRGLATSTWTKPGELQRYELRLNLLSSRLPFWERAMKLRDFREVATAVDIPEFSTVYDERDRATHTRDTLNPVIETLPILHLQGEEAIAGIREKISEWEPTLPPLGDAEGWRGVERRLRLIRDSAVDDAPVLAQRYDELREQVKLEFHRKLAWDVEQAILTRVEAHPNRRGRGRRWWYNV